MEGSERMMNDYRAISEPVCDTAKEPTMGMFIRETVDMQEETLAIICNIVNMMWGSETTSPTATPKDNIMAGLAAIRENQSAILTAVKSITAKL